MKEITFLMLDKMIGEHQRRQGTNLFLYPSIKNHIQFIYTYTG